MLFQHWATLVIWCVHSWNQITKAGKHIVLSCSQSHCLHRLGNWLVGKVQLTVLNSCPSEYRSGAKFNVWWIKCGQLQISWQFVRKLMVFNQYTFILFQKILSIVVLFNLWTAPCCTVEECGSLPLLKTIIPSVCERCQILTKQCNPFWSQTN